MWLSMMSSMIKIRTASNPNSLVRMPFFSFVSFWSCFFSKPGLGRLAGWVHDVTWQPKSSASLPSKKSPSRHQGLSHPMDRHLHAMRQRQSVLQICSSQWLVVAAQGCTASALKIAVAWGYTKELVMWIPVSRGIGDETSRSFFSFSVLFLLCLYIQFLTSIRSKRPKIFRFKRTQEALHVSSKRADQDYSFLPLLGFLVVPTAFFNDASVWIGSDSGGASDHRVKAANHELLIGLVSRAAGAKVKDLQQGLKSACLDWSWRYIAVCFGGAGKCQPVTLDVPEAEVFCRGGGPIRSRWCVGGFTVFTYNSKCQSKQKQKRGKQTIAD